MPTAGITSANNDSSLINTASDPVGQVESLAGSATVIRADGSHETLSVGAAIYEGDQIQTSADGHVGMVFQDGGKFALAESGEMRIDALVFNPSDGSGSAMFNVAKGVFVFVSGEIAKSGDDAMTVETPVASIGVRGTTVVGRAGPEGDDNSVTLLPDADGHLGEIAVTTGGGSVIVSDAYQSVSLGSHAQAPSNPQIIDPGRAEQLYGDVYKSYTRPAAEQGKGGEKETNAAPVLEIIPEGTDQSEDLGTSVGKAPLILEKPAEGSEVDIVIEAGQQINFGFDISNAHIIETSDGLKLTMADGSVVNLLWDDPTAFIQMPPLFLTNDGQLVQMGELVQMGTVDAALLDGINTASGPDIIEGGGADILLDNVIADEHNIALTHSHETDLSNPLHLAAEESLGQGALGHDSDFTGFPDLLGWLWSNGHYDAFMEMLSQIIVNQDIFFGNNDELDGYQDPYIDQYAADLPNIFHAVETPIEAAIEEAHYADVPQIEAVAEVIAETLQSGALDPEILQNAFLPDTAIGAEAILAVAMDGLQSHEGEHGDHAEVSGSLPEDHATTADLFGPSMDVAADSDALAVHDLVDMKNDPSQKLDALLDNLGEIKQEGGNVVDIAAYESGDEHPAAQLVHGFVDVIIAEKNDVEPVIS